MRFSGLSLGRKRDSARLPRSFWVLKSHLSYGVKALSAWSLLFLTGFLPSAHAQTPAAGEIIISEFRFRGKNGSSDEYVELRNRRGFALNISGWSIQTRTATGLQTTTVPVNTVIPAFGHYLFTGSAYSLGAYGTGDVAIAGDILDDSGVALLSAQGTVEDAVGFASSDAPLREGAGLPSAPTADGEYAWMRDYAGTLYKNTADSTQDFVFVSTAGASLAGTAGNLTPRLGAPSPEGLSSPSYVNPVLANGLLDPSLAQGVAPNRERVGFVPNVNLGKLLIRRTLTNNSGRTLTRVRFSVASITSLMPDPPAGQADVRLVSSDDETVTLANGTAVAVSGTTIEAGAGRPEQPLGGGLGSSALVLNTPIPPGESRSFVFALKIERSGSFSALFNFQALPNGPTGVDAAVRAGDGGSIGEDASSTDGAGQGVSLTVDGGTNATYYVKVRNRASASQALILHGTAGGNGWDVNYWDDTLGEEESNVTWQVTSSAGYTTPVLSNAPQDYFELRVTITPHVGVTPGAQLPVLLRVTSTLDPSQKDTVSLNTTRRIPPPDLAIRALKENDVALLGVGQQDVTGAAQTKEDLTVLGATLIYIVKARNHSGFTQNLLLSAPVDASGWTTRVYDGLLADPAKEITTAVLQGGWPLELASGNERLVRVEVAPSEAAAFNRLVPVTLALANDASNKDVARIEAAMQNLAGLEVSLDHGKTWTDAPAPGSVDVLSVRQNWVVGFRAKRGNLEAPWPNIPFKTKWQRGADAHYGTEVWLHFPKVTPEGEASESVQAECGNILPVQVRVLAAQ